MEQAQASSEASAADHPAAVGRSQLRTLLRTVRDMIALKNAEPSDSAAAPALASTLSRDAQMASLQQQYEASRDGLRSTFQLLDRTIASGRPADAEEDAGCAPAASEATLRRHSELCTQIAERNETIKQVMDSSRSLLSAMYMWQAHKKQLDLQQQAAQRY